uniref:SRP54_N domain-containing protein n=1 Tax=Meloidogyne hapla TaxID=6305 RepID=A0A1I8AX85_MELHA
MQRVFHEYKLFNAKNFMAGLNKIVDEIGRQMSDPFKEQTVVTESRVRQNLSAAASSTEGTTLAELVAEILERENNGTVDSTMGGIEETWNMNGNQMTAWLEF